MLADPRLNVAISSRGAPPGLDHFGLQVDTDDELSVTEPVRFLHFPPPQQGELRRAPC
jgi:hypothetical protein